MEKAHIFKTKIKRREKGISVWLTVPIIISVLIIIGIYLYFYYRAPVYRYPKKLNTYKIDRKCMMTPDGAYSAFLYAVKTNNVELCTSVIVESVVNDYAKKYYQGAFDADCYRYVLERTNEDITSEYGEDWFDKVVIEGVKTDDVKNLTYGEVNVICDGKPFDFNIPTVGFNNNYMLDYEGTKTLFDKYMCDDSRRPPYKYTKFINY